MRNIFFIIISIGLVINACSSAEECIEAPDISQISMDVKVERLEKELFSAESESEIKNLLEQHPVVTQRFLMNNNQAAEDSALVSWLFELINNPHIDTLYNDSQAVFGDLESLTNEFEKAFQYLKYYYPSFEPPAINTLITGMSSDLYVSDSLIVIGLDLFQGADAQYRPQVYNYMLRRYQPDYIVPNCLLFLSSKWNATDPTDESMLAEMIYYGKSYHLAKQLMPCTADSVLMGYSSEDMELLAEGEETIWKYFIDNQLLYETSHLEKERYLNERPATVEIHNDVPGRIGRWVGWQIIRSFEKNNPEVTLQELMKMKDAEEIFRRAKYRP